MSHEPTAAVEVLKASPSITVGSLSLAGVGLADWLIILTIVYTLLQLYFLLRDRWHKRDKSNGSK